MEASKNISVIETGEKLYTRDSAHPPGSTEPEPLGLVLCWLGVTGLEPVVTQEAQEYLQCFHVINEGN